MNKIYTGNKIKELREKEGFSREDLAKILSKEEGEIARMEIGLLYPDDLTMSRLARLFRVDIRELTEEKEECFHDKNDYTIPDLQTQQAEYLGGASVEENSYTANETPSVITPQGKVVAFRKKNAGKTTLSMGCMMLFMCLTFCGVMAFIFTIIEDKPNNIAVYIILPFVLSFMIAFAVFVIIRGVSLKGAPVNLVFDDGSGFYILNGKRYIYALYSQIRNISGINSSGKNNVYTYGTLKFMFKSPIDGISFVKLILVENVTLTAQVLKGKIKGKS